MGRFETIILSAGLLLAAAAAAARTRVVGLIAVEPSTEERALVLRVRAVLRVVLLLEII